MTAALRHEEVQLFKKSRASVCDGVNYARVIALYLYDVSFFGVFKKIVFSLFFSTKVVVGGGGKKDILIYYSARSKARSDYDFIAERLIRVSDGRADYIESDEAFSFVNAFKVALLVKSSYLLVSEYPQRWWQRIGAAFLVAKYRIVEKDTFKKELIGRKKLVTFCDAHPPENLMTQIASINGVLTATNQHGQYRILNSENMSSDAEAYENFISDKMLCWGVATRDEFARAGFSSEKFIITGWIRRWSDLKIEDAPNNSKVFGVMLNGESGRFSNESLLMAADFIAERLCYEYIVRLHPWSKPEAYKNIVGNKCVGISRIGIDDYIGLVCFSLAHMSGAVIEILHLGAPVYLLNDGRLAEIFCRPGLSYDCAAKVVDAVYEDAGSADRGRARFKALGKLYNDDDEQFTTLSSIFSES